MLYANHYVNIELDKNRTYALPLYIAIRRGNPPVVAPTYAQSA